MDSLQALRTLGPAPVLHSTLVSMLRDYKTPNNKIAPEREAGRHPFLADPSSLDIWSVEYFSQLVDRLG
ncbi:hypothetical protein [Stutzerimonas nitrititolerans]|uniref:hypothetical protein n=1 Tax=Stutzerimonas nitrititolerans TaxID=2482751 RepID=UPI00289922D8|nr:hypothetical protein [Stutzerimonas nitrititolerans]